MPSVVRCADPLRQRLIAVEGCVLVDHYGRLGGVARVGLELGAGCAVLPSDRERCVAKVVDRQVRPSAPVLTACQHCC